MQERTDATETGSAQDLAERSAKAMYEADRASRHLGMTIVSVAPGEATMTMTVRDTMVNGHGICHGGYIFLLADSTFAFACNSYNERTVAAHCDISFVRSAKLDDVLTARGREVHRQGRSGIYDITVTDQNGTTVAVFRGRSRSIGGPVIEDARD